MTTNVQCADPDEIARLRELCLIYELEAADILDKYSNSALAREVYNGAGPDAWDPKARAALTAAMRLFKPVVLIHDTQFFESDATHESFAETVRIWKANTRKIFDAEYPLRTLKMLLRSYRAERAYWWSVMEASNSAIGGNAAYQAYRNAFLHRKDLK